MGMKRCPHLHWHIETPYGETSMGTCQDCGAVKEFNNSFRQLRGDFSTGYLSYSNREIYLGKRETLYQTVWG